MKHRNAILTVAASFAALWCSLAQAQTITVSEVKKHFAEVRQEGAQFGSSLAIDDSMAYIGAPMQEVYDPKSGYTIDYAGQVTVYSRSETGELKLKQTITQPEKITQSNFGTAIASNNTDLFISSSDGTYVFKMGAKGNWEYSYKLEKMTDQATCIKFHGNYAILGAENAMSNFAGGYQYTTGKAFVYEKDASGTWMYIQTLMASDYDANESFGKDVAINDNYIAVSKRVGFSDNFIYIFKKNSKNTWDQTDKLSELSNSLAMTDSLLLIGAFIDSYDVNGKNYLSETGAVNIYKLNKDSKWVNTSKIVPPVRDTKYEQFGQKISLHHNTLIVSAYMESEDASGVNTLEKAGAFYVYTIKDDNSIEYVSKHTPKIRTANENFTYNITLYKDLILVGQPYFDFDANNANELSNAGAAYAFKLDNGMKTPHITFAAITPKTFGDPSFTLTATSTSTTPIELTSSDNTIIKIDGTQATVLSAGTCIIYATQKAEGIYYPAQALQSVTVKQATVTMTAEDKTKKQGEPNPVFTVVFSGFKGTDNESILTSQPSFYSNATETSPAGEYFINVFGARATNYTFIEKPGKLIVSSLPAFMTATTENTSIPFTPATVSISINSNTSWTIASDQAWLSTPKSSGSGIETISLSAQENRTASTRKAVVTVKAEGLADQTFEFEQATHPIVSTATNIEATVAVLPNPAQNSISVSGLDGASLQIVSYTGTVVKDIAVYDGGSIDINNLAAGLYTVVSGGTEVRFAKE